MSLEDMLRAEPSNAALTSAPTEEIEVTKEQIEKHLDKYRELISYWRLYPDRFIDFMCSLNPDNTFHFYFYQRLFLRAVLRHRYVYATFVRAWSKSFISVMALMTRAVLYPGAKLFTVAGGKGQSATILSDKVKEICSLIPAFEKEIIWDTRGTLAKTSQTKDTVIYSFKNGSTLENIAASDKTRGRRFQAGVMEECVSLPQDIMKEVIVPTMNVNRNVMGHGTDPEERLNKAQCYITTAGYKNSYGYEQLIQMLCQAVARPKEAIILGGTWKVPVKEGLLDQDFIYELKMDGTFNTDSFLREYESIWTGSAESAFFDAERFDKYRVLQMAETGFNEKLAKKGKGYYVMGVDVGHCDCTTEIVIIKVTPDHNGTPFKQIVNIYTIDRENFIAQAIEIKRIFNKFRCKAAVVDGNGMGIGLVDLLVTDMNDPDTGELLNGWGVINDEDRSYKKMETENTLPNVLYVMKANQVLNSEMYAYCKGQITNGRMRFLVDENTANNKLMSQAQGQKMSQMQRNEYKRPFVQTTIMKEQMLNLVEENEGQNIILKQSSKKIKKDKFSALIYGLYYCKLEEDKNKKRKSRDFSKLLLYTPHA